MNGWQERTEMLLGEDGLSALRSSSIAVIGLGGVGAYAAEMVVRAGVGKVILLDSDSVSRSNKNRQLLALDSTFGRSKADVMAERLRDINPELDIIILKDYLTETNIEAVLGPFRIDFLIDAIDTLAPKLALISYCVQKASIPLVSSMGSGAKFDVTKVRIADLSKSRNCPLAYIVRKKLRKRGIEKGFKVVYSEELPDRSAIVLMSEEQQQEVSNKKSQVGTVSYLPAVFGCACAQVAITSIIHRPL